MLVQSFWRRARVVFDSGPFIFDTLSFTGFPRFTFGFEIVPSGREISFGFIESLMKSSELGVAR